MKQKTFLMIITVILFAGVLVAASSDSFTLSAELNPTAQDWSDDVSYIAFKASEYWRTPSAFGGGSESFMGVKDISDFGVKSSKLKGNYILSEVSDLEFVISSNDIINGSVVLTRVNFQGIAGLPILKTL